MVCVSPFACTAAEFAVGRSNRARARGNAEQLAGAAPKYSVHDTQPCRPPRPAGTWICPIDIATPVAVSVTVPSYQAPDVPEVAIRTPTTYLRPVTQLYGSMRQLQPLPSPENMPHAPPRAPSATHTENSAILSR